MPLCTQDNNKEVNHVVVPLHMPEAMAWHRTGSELHAVLAAGAGAVHEKGG
jgi:hypothetical protein